MEDWIVDNDELLENRAGCINESLGNDQFMNIY